MTEQTAKVKPDLTEGEITMGVTFNPEKRQEVAEIKKWCASQWDMLDGVIQLLIQSDGIIRDSMRQARIMRLAAIAKTHLETFQMLAVDAVTCTDDMSHITEEVSFVSPTPGERAMKADFNVGGNPHVADIKKDTSYMYDKLNQYSIKRSKWLESKQKLGASEPEMRIAERDVESMVNNIKFAQRELQLYKLFSVKAVTR